MSGKLFETKFKFFDGIIQNCFLISLFRMIIDRVAGDLGTDVSILF